MRARLARIHALNGNSVGLKPGAVEALRPLDVRQDEILLRDELLDKQVVDTFGAKIERVNDIHLLIVKQDLRVVHVDFGLRGLLRRLGWLRLVDRLATEWLFAYRSGEKMISWKYVQPLLSDPVKRQSQAQRHRAQDPRAPPLRPGRHHRGSRPDQPLLALPRPRPRRRPPRPWRRWRTRASRPP